jgi:hypothetical protein
VNQCQWACPMAWMTYSSCPASLQLALLPCDIYRRTAKQLTSVAVWSVITLPPFEGQALLKDACHMPHMQTLWRLFRCTHWFPISNCPTTPVGCGSSITTIRAAFPSAFSSTSHMSWSCTSHSAPSATASRADWIFAEMIQSAVNRHWVVFFLLKSLAAYASVPSSAGVPPALARERDALLQLTCTQVVRTQTGAFSVVIAPRGRYIENDQFGTLSGIIMRAIVVNSGIYIYIATHVSDA